MLALDKSAAGKGDMGTAVRKWHSSKFNLI